MSREDQDRYFGEEAQAFRDQHPNFTPWRKLGDALFDELRANGWDLTRKRPLRLPTDGERNDDLIN